MQVERFSTGRVRPKRVSSGPRRYLGGRWSDETVPVNAYLVRHPDGLLLFDTGQTARVAEPGYHQRWHPYLRLARFELGPDDEIGPQLARAGIEPASVRWIVLSHLHTDHVGGVGGFPGAHVIVSRIEWERAQGLAGELRGYVPQRWPDGIVPELVDCAGPPVGPFTASFDVADDGTMLVVPTAGHTPGHVALVVRDGGSGWFLGGDMPRELPPEIAAFCADEKLTVLLAHRPG